MESIDKWSWDNWVTIWQKKKFGTTDHTKHQVEFKYIKDLNVKKKRKEKNSYKYKQHCLSESNTC